MDHSNHALLQAAGKSQMSERMRELLARAAQDHVYEQRTQGAVLDEIRQRLEGMEWLLREVRERELGGLSGGIDAVAGRIGELSTKPPSWAEGIAEHIESVGGRVEHVSGRVQSVGDRLDAVGEQVRPLSELAHIWADLTTVSESLDETLSRVQTLTEGAEETTTRFSEMGRRLDQLQSSMEAAAGRFSRLDKVLGELTQRTDKALSAVNERTERIETAVLELSEHFGDITDRVVTSAESMGEKVDTFGGRIDRVEGRLNGVDGRLEGLQGRLDGVESRLDSRFDGMDTRLENRLDGLQGRLETVDTVAEAVDRLPATLEIGEVHRLLSQLSDTDVRFDALDKRLSETSSAVEPVLQAVQARPNREEFEAALSQRLGALEETMLALAEALLRPNRKD